MRFSYLPALLLLFLLPVFTWLGFPSRGYGRQREIASLVTRLIITLCLILALSGLEIMRSAKNLAVVFLLDVSDSMPANARSAAIEYINQALSAMQPDDQAALVTFGSDALIERGMSSVKELGAITSIPFPQQTDLAEAIRLGLALFPPAAARRMVILSDGAATTGNTEEAARLAAASGVEIIVLPFLTAIGEEIWISQVDLPSHLAQGEHFNLDLTLQATQPTQAMVRILTGGAITYEGMHQINRGIQTLTIPLTAGAPGFVSYQVQISSLHDTYYQNNEIAAYSQIAGPSKILLVAPPEGESLGYSGQVRPDEYTNIKQALEAAGFALELSSPGQMPSELTILAEYSSIILVDVPARQLSTRQMEAVQSYVRDLGGGLVTVGGPTSYGVGGYFRTPLEETLPLDMQIKDEQRRPSLAIVFIIDHSGSMSETSGGIAKVELAKEAAMRSIELLTPTDRVGVIAFDDTAAWVVEMTDLENPDDIINAIGSIRSGGGTDIMAGLQAMARVLPNDPAGVKHVILLTDGGANPTGIPELVQNLYNAHGITLTTIGVGRDAALYLPQLAELGGGRYHFAGDPASIPQIFTEETVLATRSYIIEEPFHPQQASLSPIMDGINTLPQLYGYVGTSAKEAAQTILISHQGDPVLATWQYGLGKVVSFTSDATGRWAQDWVGWEGFPKFWSQAVRFTIFDRAASPFGVRVENSPSGGESLMLVVDAQQLQSSASPSSEVIFLNGYTMQANIVSPQGEVTTVALRQNAPGLYQAEFSPTEEGAYLIRVSAEPPKEGENNTVPTGPLAEIAGWVLSYSSEYRQMEPDPELLSRIAINNGGRLASEDPVDAFDHTLTAMRVARPVWTNLLLLATFLLPLDIAIRRLVLSRADLHRAWVILVSRLRLKKTSQLAQPQHPGFITSLFQAKDRSHRPIGENPPSNGEQSPVVSPMLSDSLELGSSTQQAILPPTSEPSLLVESKPSIPPAEPADAPSSTTASRLLAHKRDRQDTNKSK